MRKNKAIKRYNSYIPVLLVIVSMLTFLVARSQTSATITQSGWYRIAQNGTTLGGTNGSRAAAHFIVMDKTAAQHQTVEFLAYINFHLMPSIVVLNNSYYGSSHIPIPRIRILTPSATYAGSAVEVYIESTGSNAESFIMQDNTQSSGWTAVNWQLTNTGTGDQDGVPSGFTAYALSLKNLTTGYVTKSGTQSSYVNGNFYTSGNILLGKTIQTNTAYKLDIAGKARANEVVVNTTGADFVFDPAYRLPSLHYVSAYIKKHQHLPGIPSALDMQANGLPLGENQTKLLQKIEELTLYLLAGREEEQQMKKEIEALKKENLALKSQTKALDSMEERLRKLEASRALSDTSALATRQNSHL